MRLFTRTGKTRLLEARVLVVVVLIAGSASARGLSGHSPAGYDRSEYEQMQSRVVALDCTTFDMLTDPGFTSVPYDDDNYYDSTNQWYRFQYAEEPSSAAERFIYGAIPSAPGDFRLEYQIEIVSPGYLVYVGLNSATSTDDLVAMYFYNQPTGQGPKIGTGLFHDGAYMSAHGHDLTDQNPPNTEYHVVIERTGSSVYYELWNEDQTSLIASVTSPLDYVDTMNYFFIWCYGGQNGGIVGEARLKHVSVCVPASCATFDMLTDPGFTSVPYDDDNYYDSTNHWYRFQYAEEPSSAAERFIYGAIPSAPGDFRLEYQIEIVSPGYLVYVGLNSATSTDDLIAMYFYNQPTGQGPKIGTGLFHDGAYMSAHGYDLTDQNPPNTEYHVVIERTGSSVYYELWNEDQTSLIASVTSPLDYVDTMNYFFIWCFGGQNGGIVGEARLKHVSVCDPRLEIFFDDFESGDTSAWSAVVP